MNLETQPLCSFSQDFSWSCCHWAAYLDAFWRPSLWVKHLMQPLIICQCPRGYFLAVLWCSLEGSSTVEWGQQPREPGCMLCDNAGGVFNYECMELGSKSLLVTETRRVQNPFSWIQHTTCQGRFPGLSQSPDTLGCSRASMVAALFSMEEVSVPLRGLFQGVTRLPGEVGGL